MDAARDADRAGRLAAIPAEPYESAEIDGANLWQVFRYITLPLITPFLFIAAMIRMIDAVKSFDIIFAISKAAGLGVGDDQPLPLQRGFTYYDIATARRSRWCSSPDRGARRRAPAPAPAHAVERDRSSA